MIHYREYCESLLTAKRAVRTMCVVGPDPELIDMIYKAVGADLTELESLAGGSAAIEEWTRSAALDAEKRRLLQRSLAALSRCEPLQRAMTIALMRDLVEMVEEWAKVSSERSKRAQDGADPTDIKPAYFATTAGFAARTTNLVAIRSSGRTSDRPPVSVSVG